MSVLSEVKHNFDCHKNDNLNKNETIETNGTTTYWSMDSLSKQYALHKAVFNNDIKLISQLLRNYDINHKDIHGLYQSFIHFIKRNIYLYFSFKSCKKYENV
jgi:hypothetical protein